MRALQHEPERERDRRAEQDDEQVVERDRGAEERERAGQLGRPAHGFLLGAPEDLRGVAQDEAERVGEQELVELLLAVEVAEQHALDDAAQQRDPEGRAEGGDPEEARARPEPQHRLVRQIRAQHVEGAVREVQDAQHPEDQRQARRDQKQKHGSREAAQALREDKRRVRHSA